MTWTKEWPKKPGMYWFYGYVFGKISCGSPSEPVLSLVTVNKTGTGCAYVMDGHFLYENQAECAHFHDVDAPPLPDLEE